MARERDDLIQIENVSVEFRLPQAVLRAVDDVSLAVRRGEILGVVGESGSGKSTLSATILNAVPPPGRITAGRVLFEGWDVLSFGEEELRQYRWRDVATVFQAAQNSLNPVLKVKEQFLDTAAAHDEFPENKVLAKARDLLRFVRLEPDQVLDSYPHQLSGGMKQRTIIALSLLLDPKVLVLDEPTTALDVITQAYVMNILRQIHEELQITMLFLTHDVCIMAKVADRIAVMYAGQVVELGSVYDIFYQPLHPYTRGLINAAPSLTDDVTKRKAIPGSPPDLTCLPPGCRFAPRCGLCREGTCDGQERGVLVEVGDGHYTTCCQWRTMGA